MIHNFTMGCCMDMVNSAIYLCGVAAIIKWVDEKFFKDCINAQRTAVFMRLISPLLGIRWEIRGKEILGSDQGCVVVMNHQTSFDVLGMFWSWRYFNRMAPVAKKELFYFWPFGLACYVTGVVFIDRGNSSKAKAQLDKAARSMHRDGTKLLIFPEGTRGKSRQISTFKKGAFHMAVTCQVPILPVVVSPYYFINPRRNFFGTGRVVLEALPPVPTSGLGPEDVPALTEKVRTLMAEHYTKLAEELKGDYPPDYPGFY